MKITVFCDFDGPIMDVSSRYYQAYKIALADTQAQCTGQRTTLFTRPLSKKQFWQMKRVRVRDLEIARRSGLPQEQLHFFLQRVHQIVNQPALLQYDRLQSKARQALLSLHSQGVELVLVTLRRQEQVVCILQNCGLAQLFSHICGTQDEGAAYSNYAELKTQLLTKFLGEQPKRSWRNYSAWMVGDTEADILAGQSLNIPTIALTCGIRSCSYLEKFKPTLIHSDLSNAAGYLLEYCQLLAA